MGRHLGGGPIRRNSVRRRRSQNRARSSATHKRQPARQTPAIFDSASIPPGSPRSTPMSSSQAQLSRALLRTPAASEPASTRRPRRPNRSYVKCGLDLPNLTIGPVFPFSPPGELSSPRGSVFGPDCGAPLRHRAFPSIHDHFPITIQPKFCG